MKKILKVFVYCFGGIIASIMGFSVLRDWQAWFIILLYATVVTLIYDMERK